MLLASLSVTDLALTVAIGFVGGVAGGLLGIGGSIVMIPLLGLAFGPNQQLYQATCMIVNVVVAAGAVHRHAKAGSVRRECVIWMLPLAGIFVIVGVLLGNRIPSRQLQIAFGIFLLYTATAELVRSLRRVPDHDAPAAPVRIRRVAPIGAATGFLAGLLGIGGGTIAVPLLRTLARLPLRQAIGTSSAVMIAASAIGAIAKNASLPALTAPDGSPLRISTSLTLAAALAPASLLGAVVGSRLTYRLPLGVVRLAFAVLIAIAGLRMTGLLG
ncbi:MAG: sulfite exporter TauE/SafE family protein [Phycisphaerae bacterium]|nr:sulfite exporter TauE/SafE family protein [Phycisphaerae bacterium]